MSRIVRVEMCRYDYRVTGRFKFLKPGTDGVVRRPSVLIRLTDDNGYQGWGQAAPMPTWSYETPETVESTLQHYIAPAILGADPEDIQQIHARMHEAIKPAFSIGQPMCKAGVDIACYDLVGRKRGAPVFHLLGGTGLRTLTLSWTVAASNIEEAEKQMEKGLRKGYSHFNIKVGAPQSPEYDVRLAMMVRRHAPNCFLWADANTGYTLETALQVAPRMADAGVNVLESPLPPAQIRAYQTLRKQGALPVLMDEGILSPVEAEEFIALGMLDGIALKPARNAGLWYSRQIVRLLKENGLMVLGSGLTDPDLVLASAIHLYSWADIRLPCALNAPQFLGEWLTGEALQPQQGQIYVPTSPGLGVQVTPAVESRLEIIAEA